MYCPNCNKKVEGEMFCGECGTKLIEKPAAQTGGINLNLGDANAISGGMHLQDSHDTTNIDNSVNNTSNVTNINDQSQHFDNSKTIYDNGTKNYYQTTQEAQKTDTQIEQGNVETFLLAVRRCLSDGRLSVRKEAELEQIARSCHIAPDKARLLIDGEVKNARILHGEQGNDYYITKIVTDIVNALNANQRDVIDFQFNALKELAKIVDDQNVQYYSSMVQASLNPAGCVIEYMSHPVDNYWYMYWVCIAYIKLGQPDKMGPIMARLNGFGQPNGDIDLLTATMNLGIYNQTKNMGFLQQVQSNLKSAQQNGISQQLYPMLNALHETVSPSPCIDKRYEFYIETTLKEFSGDVKTKLMMSQMPEIPHASQIPPIPEIPTIDPQSIKLAQSQGWSAKDVASQMGLGQMPSMQDMQRQMTTMQNQILGVPPVPGVVAPPPFPNVDD